MKDANKEFACRYVDDEEDEEDEVDDEDDEDFDEGAEGEEGEDEEENGVTGKTTILTPNHGLVLCLSMDNVQVWQTSSQKG